jgi:hypothetical protein
MATVGQIVKYRVSATDVDQVVVRRNTGSNVTDDFGNAPVSGSVLPMIVTLVLDGGAVNGQVILDGRDHF